MQHPPKTRGSGWGHHGGTRVYRLWTVLCVPVSVEAEAISSKEWLLVSTFNSSLWSTSCLALNLYFSLPHDTLHDDVAFPHEGPSIVARRPVFCSEGCTWLPTSV
eukprot:1071564-Amphidinium_carterae.1